MKRLFNKIISIAVITLSAITFSACSKADENVLYLYNWTYYTPDQVLKQFENEFNCKVIVSYYDSNEQMYSKIKAGGNKYDIVIPSQDYVSIMINQGMLQELDQNKLTNTKNINPKVLEKATYDPTMKYAVPYYFGAAGIAVNKTKVNTSDYERNWNIFSDKRFAGHATMMDDMREVIGDALTHLGYSVNSTDDDQLAKAQDLVANNWKPNLVKFDAESFGKQFAAGDFWLCQGYAEVIHGEVPEDKWEETIDFFIPEEGGPSYLDSMCILKNSKHSALANDFINYIHRPEIYAQFLDAFHFPCFVNLEAEQYMTTKPMYEASQMDNCELKNDIGEALDKYNNIWQEIRYTD